MANDYYVYVYLDLRKPGKYFYDDLEFDFEPFYIGKGKGFRSIEHWRSCYKYFNYKNNLKLKKIIKDNENKEKLLTIRQLQILNYSKEECVIIWQSGLSNHDALMLEKEMIFKIGRKIFKNGPLTNYAEGGNGGPTLSNKQIANRKKQYKKLSCDWLKYIYQVRDQKGHIKSITNLQTYCEKNTLKPKSIYKFHLKNNNIVYHKGYFFKRLNKDNSMCEGDYKIPKIRQRKLYNLININTNR